jgi:hypothetical protein
MRRDVSFRWPRSSGEIVYALLVAGMLGGMLISMPLWMTGRAFPHLPCVAWFPPFPEPFDGLFLCLTSLLLLLPVFVPGRNGLVWCSLAACVLLALQDQIRWQPWFYQYLLMLTAAALAGDRRAPAFHLSCRIVIVCLYLWSGLHKFSPGYLRMYEATFVAPLSGAWPSWAVEAVRHGAPAGPWIEIGMALALCFRRTRKAGVVLAVATHIAIFLLTGPVGTNRNAVVWPWNVLMAVLVIILFWSAREFGWKALRTPRHMAAALVAVFMAGFMPAFSIPEKWDRYLSFHLYSGSGRRLIIVVDDAAAAALPESWRQRLIKSTVDPALRELRFLEWSLDELRAPVPGDPRHMMALARHCAAMRFAQAGRVRFYLDFPFITERGWETFSVQQIREMRAIPELKQREWQTGGAPRAL